jgi:protein-S-isoprenylcysteine O-methyltransferase Ste14
VRSPTDHTFRYFGIPIIAIGAAGLVWCIWQFFSEGRGTLAPVDPPKHLVVRGLYRYVRNPMYVGNFFLILGMAIAANTWHFMIIGIPLAIANFKLIEISLMPLGKQIVRKQPRPVGPVPPRATGAPSQMP